MRTIQLHPDPENKSLTWKSTSYTAIEFMLIQSKSYCQICELNFAHTPTHLVSLSVITTLALISRVDLQSLSPESRVSV